MKSPSTVNCPAGLQGEKRWCQLNLFSLVFHHYYSVPPTCINLVSSIFLPSSSPYCPLLSYLLTVDHLLSHPFFSLVTLFIFVFHFLDYLLYLPYTLFSSHHLTSCLSSSSYVPLPPPFAFLMSPSGHLIHPALPPYLPFFFLLLSHTSHHLLNGSLRFPILLSPFSLS